MNEHVATIMLVGLSVGTFGLTATMMLAWCPHLCDSTIDEPFNNPPHPTASHGSHPNPAAGSCHIEATRSVISTSIGVRLVPTTREVCQ